MGFSTVSASNLTVVVMSRDWVLFCVLLQGRAYVAQAGWSQTHYEAETGLGCPWQRFPSSGTTDRHTMSNMFLF